MIITRIFQILLLLSGIINGVLGDYVMAMLTIIMVELINIDIAIQTTKIFKKD